MVEIIDFNKAKKNMDKQLRAILNKEKQDKKLIKKCCADNEFIEERDDAIKGKIYQVDKHTKITLWDDGGYMIIRDYFGD